MGAKRLLEIFAITQWVCSFLFLGFFCLGLVIYLGFTRLWPLTLVYLAWYLYDRLSPHKGGRRVEAIRRWKVWEHFRDYFPLKLVKTCDLDPHKNYLFACHPHGVLCVSHFGNFATEATGFSKLFPGIDPHLIVLDGQFQFPLYREYFMTTGSCGCNKNSLEYILKSKGQGNAACLIVGGALEALAAHPGHFNLNLNKKKGFIKSAIRTGASIVPVFSFGENDLYNQVPNPIGSKLRRFQMMATTYLGLSPPFFYARGIVPYSKPVTTVVGPPIEVNQNDTPTSEEINDLHTIYVAALIDLFETHKHKYGVAKGTHLNLF
ncbi:MOGAT1 [Bugula neritina]|uniref:Acyltransferase n=1 Tax=Bugula neritina TaxID=10212 RepID=A0A7J7JZ20_BUGNE|nr:MOGAT1 [Bugula neritina]